jgi:hypothetical protein
MVRGAWVVAALLALGQADKASLIEGTTGASSGDLEVQTGGLVLREGEVGSAFGTVRKASKTRKLAYYVLFKHSFTSRSKSNTSEEATAVDDKARGSQELELDGKKLTVLYKIEVDLRARKVLREELTLNGKTINLARGRVFLVDMTVNPPKWQQKKLKLPAEVADAQDRKSAEELARRVVAALVKQDRKVKAFVAEAGR